MPYNETQIALIKELRGDICRCGKPKTPVMSFCRVCFYRLPRDLRYVLYASIGNGYEQAYAEVLKVLGFSEAVK